jgi:hypothetical protein
MRCTVNLSHRGERAKRESGMDVSDTRTTG